MTQTAGDAFWEWAIEAYAREGVKPAALQLQDGCGACVMALLCLCWRATLGIVEDSGSIGALRARAALLEEHLLVPLRAARTTLAAAAPHVYPAGAAREALLARELVIERLQAGPLAACPGAKGARPVAAVGSAVRAITLYLRALGVAEPEATRAARAFARATLSARY